MQRFSIFTLALINGAGIMAFEMISGKMLAPFYGSSLEVWSVTLAIVLSGLALGYWLGGIWSARYQQLSSLSWLLILASVTVVAAPSLSNALFIIAYKEFGLLGSIVSSLFIVLPFMILTGMVSPILIHIISRTNTKSGDAAGKIFSVSTIGGVIATIVTGFWLITTVGLETSTILLASLYLVVGISLVIGNNPKQNRLVWLTSSVALVLIVASWFGGSLHKYPGLLYRQTSLYGEILVADIPLHYRNKTYPRRLFLHNRVGQTNTNTDKGCSLWDYAHYMISVAGSRPSGSKALLLGLAGGNIANELVALGFKVDAVDLDPRVLGVAKRFFNLSPKVKFIEDDARHFLNINNKKYDLIVVDLFAGEGIPSHVVTIESITHMQRFLSANGLILINFHGNIQGSLGLGSRAVYKTLVASGLHTKYIATPGGEFDRNIIFIATPNHDQDYFSQQAYRLTSCNRDWKVPLPPHVRAMNPADYQSAPLLKDEYPMLERLNHKVFQAWRKYAIDHYLLELKEQGVPLF